jgi:hypothetical protein
MLSIKSWMVDELLNMYNTLFNMLRWITTTYLTVICFQYTITSIKSDTFNNITKLYRLSIFVLFCWHSMIYITCIWRLNRFETLFNIYFTVICIPLYNHINKIRHVQQHCEWFMLSIFCFCCCCRHSMT